MTGAGPDLPPPDQPFDVDTAGHRWPMGARKVELDDGCPRFYGRFDHRDVATAQRAFPGRRAVILPHDDAGGRYGDLLLLPSGVDAVERLLANYRQALDADWAQERQRLLDRFRGELHGRYSTPGELDSETTGGTS
jgi:hypothetical protein